MSKYTNKGVRTFQILSASLIVATWLIVGPGMLSGFSLPEKVEFVLVNGPALLFSFWLVSNNRNFMRCEYRAWKRIFGK